LGPLVSTPWNRHYTGRSEVANGGNREEAPCEDEGESLADIIAFEGDKSDLFREIGRFVFEYSRLEHDLRTYLRRKAQVPFDFNTPIMSAFDFARLCNALIAVSEHVSRSSMKPTNYFENEGDLDEQSDAIVKLRAHLAEAIRAGNERRGPKAVKKRRKVD
jgi:hypothetical protein